MILPIILAISLPLPDGGYLTHRSPVYQMREFVSEPRRFSHLFSFPAGYEVQSSTNLRDWVTTLTCTNTYTVVLDCNPTGNRFWRIIPVVTQNYSSKLKAP